ncbi:MAG: nicotinamide-nucleotide amidohydrolase family protein [Actinomycetota bacterium]|nr:nicotinamide-nucleotide amidohydrolase family protein [Actinomycetota bacterium]
MSAPPRTHVVLTGSELARGLVRDQNGPFLAGELTRIGLEPARTVVVGDHPEELEGALRDGVTADLCVISGGLGPTHDDRTVELLARVLGRRLLVDEELAREIASVARRVAERLGRPEAELAVGVRKQASLPEGGVSLGLAGTAPAVLVEHADGVAVALPGPPGELRRLWPNVLASEPVRRLVTRARKREHRLLRFFRVPEAAVAAALADAGGEGEGVEVTVCARNYEIEVDLYVDQGGEKRASALEGELATRFRDALFARDERPIAEIVLDLCRARHIRLATAESCTGGLVGAELTAVPGASDVYAGGVVAYSNEAKRSMLGVPASVLERNGAVSAETASEMAKGVLRQLEADVALAVTGVAGPGGGTAEKPVGLVYLDVEAGPLGRRGFESRLHGNRDEIRARAAVQVLHLVREVLVRDRDMSR